ncbi:hypothetical protein HHK36_011105 [Tetracentron sinense]|uniref:SHSP domain-containing protein n=1 Tax=Tetracentron sinense TaxID=13715 RepID=A0A834Z9L7_TETSI|nr:hypothetical protein HHK36_011105 [Tetracentron sinense]
MSIIPNFFGGRRSNIFDPFSLDIWDPFQISEERSKVLQISGEKSKEQEEKNDKLHRVERSSGKFLRRFRLPENAKVDQVKATMENGVLTVLFPRKSVKLLKLINKNSIEKWESPVSTITTCSQEEVGVLQQCQLMIFYSQLY